MLKTYKKNMKMLNCGCGEVYHKKWINMDFNAKGNPYIISHNLLHGLPFESNSFDYIYHSNFLEHLTPAQAEKFSKECYRVLKPSGILRVVVPDLENVCKRYLDLLDSVRKDEGRFNSKYTYITIELIDQMTRDYAGGLLGECLSHKEKYQNFKIDKNFLYERIGSAYSNFKKEEIVIQKHIGFQQIIKAMLGNLKCYQYYMAGKYALSGERHKWMYDNYSLQQLLKQCGFRDTKEYEYNQSAIQNFAKYRLEEDRYGKEYKPNSIYMEGCKP